MDWLAGAYEGAKLGLLLGAVILLFAVLHGQKDCHYLKPVTHPAHVYQCAARP